MADFIDDIATYLQANSVGTLGTNLFEGRFPESPDACTAVLWTGGTQPDVDLPLKDPTFQVMIRSTSWVDGKTKLDLVRSLLHQQSGVELVEDQTFFYYILAISEGGHLGQDDNGRDLFSINFRTKLR